MRPRTGVGNIRLSIPFWGLDYVSKMLNLTLPALLAPGNLPILAEEFRVEVALVTESKFFGALRASRAFQALQRVADVRLVPLDDLLTGVPGDYGPVLAFALIRGYEDLGERMLDYYLMFLNADFILADGSYRTVARLIKEGHPVIHCPSFRGVLEDVTPELEKRVSTKDGVLAVPPRELVALALRHKHISVKARIVNQRLCHQRWMDQFYWYVDDCTLIGYQCPIALVGLRPERVVTRPALMFDYGFIPEICPTAPKYYISDSDDFFMLEPQKRDSGRDLVRLGWPTTEELLAYLAAYSTKEQRDCGRQMHVFHSADLPPDMSAVAAESKAYIAALLGRLGPPHPHDRHPLFHDWWRGVLARIDERRFSLAEERHRAANHSEDPRVDGALEDRPGPGIGAAEPVAPAPQAARAPVDATPGDSDRSALHTLSRTVYRWLFGRPGRQFKVGHPLWLGTHWLSQTFEAEASAGGRILWVSTTSTGLPHLAKRADVTILPTEFARELPDSFLFGDDPFDACLFDLSLQECTGFRKMYERLRPHVRNGGHVYLSVTNPGDGSISLNDPNFCETALPDTDVSEGGFAGHRIHHVVRRLYEYGTRPRFANRALQAAVHAATLIALAPLAYVANRRMVQRTARPYTPDWLTMFARFTIVRREGWLTHEPGVSATVDELDQRLEASRSPLADEIERLKQQVADLTRAIADRGKLDYQLLMAQQGLLAGLDDLDPGFRPLMESVKPYTMTSLERMYALYKSVEYVTRAGIPGDVLECGVWRGGSMMLVAKTLLALGDTSRTLHLFDTYSGHPKPDAEHDVDLWGNRAIDQWVDYRETDESSDWARVSIDEVRANMASTGYPMDKVVLVKGMVERTAMTHWPRGLALARLDTDWYASAKAALEAAWPCLSPGGVLIVDDYGHYRGQRKAVDEYFVENPVLLHRVDYSCRTIVKVA